MPDSPRNGTKQVYIRKIDALGSQIGRLENDAARRAMALMLDAQRKINTRISALGESDGWRIANARSLQAQVDDIMAEFRRDYGVAFSSVLGNAYENGIQAVDEPLGVSGVVLRPARLSRNVIEVLQGFSADLIQKVSAEVIASVNSIITSSMLGIESPFAAQRRIAQVLGASDSLRELTGVSARAEKIFRTEVGRVQSIATQARQQEVAQDVEDIEKVWTATGDGRTRSGHLTAHGQHVGVDEYFEVAAKVGQPMEELMYPRDPRGSAGNTIQCRCRSTTWRAGYGAFLPRTTGRVDVEKERRAEEAFVIVRRVWPGATWRAAG